MPAVRSLGKFGRQIQVGCTTRHATVATKYSKSTDWNWNRDNDRRVYDYYKVPPYWGV